MSDCLKHTGVISRELPGHWVVRISIPHACAGCSVRSSCSTASQPAREIVVKKDTRLFATGDEVQVNLDRNEGLKAVVLAYVLPLCLFLIVLVISSGLFSHQWLAGVLSLLVLVPYYFILFRFSTVLNRSFHCSIEKMPQGI